MENEKKILELKKKQLQLVKEQRRLEHVLPHLYMPMYSWQREVFDSTNRINLLTAANQIGKSSALIRRAIAHATEPDRWQKFWPTKPRQFWYFYPDGATVEREVETKWKAEWLPRDEMMRNSRYGWKIKVKNSIPYSITFDSGAVIYFMMYTKKAANIQAGSVHEIFVDEELPMDLYDEVMFRLTATNGIFTTGFTPTLNQLFWKQAMSGNEVLPSAKKWVISMYDCLRYEDGTPSRIMTLDKIKLAEEKCKSEVERQRRVFGKFVTEQGRSYYAFDYDINVCTPYPINDWQIYAGVDYGSGTDTEAYYKGKKNHPASIVFLAVRPDNKKAAVFKAWRGDGEKTTAGDVFVKYQQMSKGLNIVQACYDHAAVDFGTIAARNGYSFAKANKSRDIGEDLVNTLFKNKMLDVFDKDPNCLKLAAELMSIMVSSQTAGNKREDDLADALRYTSLLVPWDLSEVGTNSGEEEIIKIPKVLSEEELIAMQIKDRRGELPRLDEGTEWGEVEDEFEYWNQEYG